VRIAITGIRDLARRSYPTVEIAILEALAVPGLTTLYFGGALGVDSVALEAAGPYAHAVDLVVVVPFTVDKQPREAQWVIETWADKIVELKQAFSKSAYLRRNDEMVRRADRVLAFTDGHDSGGTAYTIRKAEALGKPIDIVLVESSVQVNPPVLDTLSAPVYVYSRYVSASVGRDSTSELIRAMKIGEAGQIQQLSLVRKLVKLIEQTPELAEIEAVAVMPRRMPGQESDLTYLGQMVAQLTNKQFLPSWLIRERQPTGGTYLRYRVRFPAAEHARTLRVAASTAKVSSVLLIDNAITTGASLEGAFKAIKRDAPKVKITGLAVLDAT
jgi:predicted amidophosphoribosyltransferase